MKKVLSIILSVVLIFSLSVSSFAAMYTFRTTEDDGSSWIYHFGSFEQDATDAGVYLNGTKYALDGENGERADSTAYETALEAAQTSGKYGIGFNVTDYTKESYELQSYYVKDGNETKGEIETIALAEEEIDENKVATLSSITLSLADDISYSVPLQDGVYNYYLSTTDLGMTSTQVRGTVDRNSTAVPTVEGATVTEKTYTVRANDSTADYVGFNKEFTVTSKDGTVTQRYIVQGAADGYAPVLEDADSSDKTNGTETSITTGKGRYSLVKFYIGNIDATKLNTVNINLTANYDPTDSRFTDSNPFSIKLVEDNNWSELTLSSDDNITLGEDVQTFSFNAKTTPVQVDITKYIEKALNADKDYITLYIQANETKNFTYGIYSKESWSQNKNSGAAKYPPHLMYTYK